MEFIEYSKCSTCKKAKEYLISNSIKFIDREIKEKTPTKEEINMWIKKYNLDIKKLFNTSGMIYRNLNMKDRMDSLLMEEKIDLLASNPMLIKRPILVGDNKILIGFREKEYDEYFR